jgi:hypothetical protein
VVFVWCDIKVKVILSILYFRLFINAFICMIHVSKCHMMLCVVLFEYISICIMQELYRSLLKGWMASMQNGNMRSFEVSRSKAVICLVFAFGVKMTINVRLSWRNDIFIFFINLLYILFLNLPLNSWNPHWAPQIQW